VPRIRTAKTLAKRIDLQYFAKLNPFRRWKLLLSIGLPVVAAVWLIGETVFSKQQIYTSGPLSSSHAVFGKQCSLCHVRGANYSANVEDKACLACHDAPAHNQQQASLPACSSCHLEHRGSLQLSATGDSACAQCHGDLKTKNGELHFDAHVSGFDHKHPQFAALREGASDPGTIRLNHYVHLQPTLRGPGGTVQMQCYDCHRANNVNETWPYSVAVVQPASQQPVAISLGEGQQRKRRSVEAGPGAYMAPIRYVNQCAACHVLQFDPLIATPAPHDKPEVVRAFIVQKLSQYVAEHPEVTRGDPGFFPEADSRNVLQPLGETQTPRNFLHPLEQGAPVEGGTRSYSGGARSPQEWIQQRTATAERLLWEKNCKVCHMVTQGGGSGLPTFVKAVVPTRWFPHAEFDHQSHRMMQCTACHSNIPQSKQTSDINIPGIEVCRDCHQQRGPVAQAAEGRCFECHSYHDWRSERRVQGRYDLTQLLKGGPISPPPAAPGTSPDTPESK
jgi:hypothetical protein